MASDNTDKTGTTSGADAEPTTSEGTTRDSGRPGRGVATSKKRGPSGNPGKLPSGKEKRSRKPKDELRVLDDPISARAYRSPRFLVGLLLSLAGIAWIAYYYVQVRPEPGAEAGGPAFMGDLERWNYAIGFGLVMLGLVVMAHKSTPLGRGRGVVVGMLGCFVIGLIWICTFYVITDDISVMPVMNDLGQFNLVVGIAFMAVGFTFATKWE